MVEPSNVLDIQSDGAHNRVKLCAVDHFERIVGHIAREYTRQGLGLKKEQLQ